MSVLVTIQKSGLTPAQFGQLADVPPEIEWLAHITNPKTRRAYKNDVSKFSAFAGLNSSAELGAVSRAHVIAWRRPRSPRVGRHQDPPKTPRAPFSPLGRDRHLAEVCAVFQAVIATGRIDSSENATWPKNPSLKYGCHFESAQWDEASRGTA